MKNINRLVKRVAALVLMLLPLSALAIPAAEQLPVRSFAIGSPTPDKFASFIDFINDDLSKTAVNQLFLPLWNSYSFRALSA